MNNNLIKDDGTLYTVVKDENGNPQQVVIEPYKHSWEPWRIAGSVIYDAKGNEVVRVNTKRSYVADDEQIVSRVKAMARIVACVNACDGMENPVMSIPLMTGELKHLKSQRDAALAQADELQAQLSSLANEYSATLGKNNIMLAALQRWVKEWESTPNPKQRANNYAIEQEIIKAIAIAKGEEQ